MAGSLRRERLKPLAVASGWRSVPRRRHFRNPAPIAALYPTKFFVPGRLLLTYFRRLRLFLACVAVLGLVLHGAAIGSPAGAHDCAAGSRHALPAHASAHAFPDAASLPDTAEADKTESGAKSACCAPCCLSALVPPASSETSYVPHGIRVPSHAETALGVVPEGIRRPPRPLA
jgi:hypothetical protein